MQIASHTNPKNLPLDSDGKRGWTNSFFGCFDDCGTCRFSWLAFILVEAHLRPQVSPPPSVPVSCILRSVPGLTISPTADLLIPLVAMPAVVLVSAM